MPTILLSRGGSWKFRCASVHTEFPPTHLRVLAPAFDVIFLQVGSCSMCQLGGRMGATACTDMGIEATESLGPLLPHPNSAGHVLQLLLNYCEISSTSSDSSSKTHAATLVSPQLGSATGLALRPYLPFRSTRRCAAECRSS